MSGPPYMPLYVADYLADTSHLSTLEHGAYMLLMIHYWRTGAALPKDDPVLARISRLSLKVWKSIKPTIASLFNNDWSHSRLDTELTTYRNKHPARVAAGSAGGRAAAQNRKLAGDELSKYQHAQKAIQLVRLGFDESDAAKERVETAKSLKLNNGDIANATPLPEQTASTDTSNAAPSSSELIKKIESSSSSSTEPARESDDEELLLILKKAANGRIAPGCVNVAPIRRLIAEGIDLRLDILPLFQTVVAKYLASPLKTFGAAWLREELRAAARAQEARRQTASCR
jgi:uncharacterized protein YdaU (DUF1376 family)